MKIYSKPEIEITFVHIECHLCAPSTWSVNGSKSPIKEADPNDDEPTGAKAWGGVPSAWDSLEDEWE